MGRIVGDEMVEPVVGFLLGATDVDGGPTNEQLAVLGALVSGYWGRTDLDLATVAPLGTADASTFADPAVRRRVRELMVLLELCRHPPSMAQIDRVDEYAAALGETGPGLVLARELVAEGAAAAQADYYRFVEGKDLDLQEVTLRDMGDDASAIEGLAARLHALRELPPDTLGHQYVEFYRRNGIQLPGDDPNQPALFVSHDMCHVIAGYEPTGQGEIALGAMQLAVEDSDIHWLQFLGNLAVHEAGYLSTPGIVAKTETLTRPGAAAMLAEAFARGAACTDNFTDADHLALVELPLEGVRRQFGVPPLELAV
jgi:hypothetical protein